MEVTRPEQGAPEREPGAEAGTRPQRLLVIVERGRHETYQRVRDDQEAAGEATVIWDRRGPERRQERVPPIWSDRRFQDRRQPAPDTWSTYGFLVVPART